MVPTCFQSSLKSEPESSLVGVAQVALKSTPEVVVHDGKIPFFERTQLDAALTDHLPISRRDAQDGFQESSLFSFFVLCRLTEKKVAGKACEKHFLVIGEVCGKSNFERLVLAQEAVRPDKTGIVAKLLSRASAH